MDKRIHQGRNIKRLREVQGIKQDALAADLGETWSQKKISQLEDKEEIDHDLLQKVATALKVPVSALEKMDDDGVVNIISSTFNDTSSVAVNYQPTFNSLDKWLESLNEIKQLYERLLQSEREKVENAPTDTQAEINIERRLFRVAFFVYSPLHCDVLTGSQQFRLDSKKLLY